MQSKNGFIFLEGDSPGESLSNSLEVPETVLNPDDQLQRLSGTQTSCPVFVQGNACGGGGNSLDTAPKHGVDVRLTLLTHHFLQRLLDPSLSRASD